MLKLVPVPTNVIKPASAYQLIVPVPAAVKVADSPEQIVAPDEVGAVGNGLTVTITAVKALAQVFPSTSCT